MKKVIRRDVLRKRDEIPPETRSVKNTLIKQRFFSLPEFTDAKTVLFYASFRSEVETLSIIKESLNMNKRVVVPKVDRERHRLLLYEIKDIGELTAGFMGIPEPSLPEERLMNIDKIDLIVLPGSVFDYSGNRLGYGGGYYDILLSEMHKKIPVVALAFEEQLVESIPSETHDIKVDIIITDKRVIRT
jgi:5-formyltetrahydrofolate cyclo-ligase